MATVLFSETKQVEISRQACAFKSKENSEENKYQKDNKRGFVIWAVCAITLVIMHFAQDLPKLFLWITS